MPTACHRPENDVDAIIMGFGAGVIYFSSTMKKQLLFANVKTVSSHECQKYYPFINKDAVFCATNTQLKLSEHGDSGGPLVTTSDGTLTGIIIMGNRKQCISNPFQRFTNINWLRLHFQPILELMHSQTFTFISIGSTKLPAWICRNANFNEIINVQQFRV